MACSLEDMHKTVLQQKTFCQYNSWCLNIRLNFRESLLIVPMTTVRRETDEADRSQSKLSYKLIFYPFIIKFNELCDLLILANKTFKVEK